MQNIHLKKLQERLRNRSSIVTPLKEAPTPNNKVRTYAQAMTTPRSIVSETNSKEIQELKTMLHKQQMNIQQITTQARTLATSRLTPDTAITDMIKQITEQQHEKFRVMMKDMMQTVFQQMYAMIQMMMHPGHNPPGPYRFPETNRPEGYPQYESPSTANTINMTPPSNASHNNPRPPPLQFPHHQSTVMGMA